jgi:hypothetical protein
MEYMKRIVFLWLISCAFAFGQVGEKPYLQTLTLGTNVIGTANTNTQQGSITKLLRGSTTARIWVKVNGGAGATASNSLTYFISPAFVSGTNFVNTNIVSWQNTDIKVTVTPTGTTDSIGSTWLNLGGVEYIVPTAIVNLSGGTVTNGTGTTNCWITYHARP